MWEERDESVGKLFALERRQWGESFRAWWWRMVGREAEGLWFGYRSPDTDIDIDRLCLGGDSGTRQKQKCWMKKWLEAGSIEGDHFSL